MNWKAWIYSLVSAAIGGAASSLGAILVAPQDFNLSKLGLEHIGAVAVAGAVIPVLAILQKSPLPAPLAVAMNAPNTTVNVSNPASTTPSVVVTTPPKP